MCRHDKMSFEKNLLTVRSFCHLSRTKRVLHGDVDQLRIIEKKLLSGVMFNREGKVSLATFLSGILTSVFTSILVVNFFSLELNSFQNLFILFTVPTGTYALFCVIMYFATSLNDFEVIYTGTRNKTIYNFPVFFSVF